MFPPTFLTYLKHSYKAVFSPNMYTKSRTKLEMAIPVWRHQLKFMDNQVKYVAWFGVFANINSSRLLKSIENDAMWNKHLPKSFSAIIFLASFVLSSQDAWHFCINEQLEITIASHEGREVWHHDMNIHDTSNCSLFELAKEFKLFLNYLPLFLTSLIFLLYLPLTTWSSSFETQVSQAHQKT